MSYSIKHLFHIAAPREKIYEAITSIDGLSNWWTKDTTGDAGKGGILKFRFGGHGPDMKVIKAEPNTVLSWECVGGIEDWNGHVFTFALDENEGKTRVRFSQDGWEQQNDSYAACCFTWARYMESLRQYCQTGRGEGFGSEGYRK